MTAVGETILSARMVCPLCDEEVRVLITGELVASSSGVVLRTWDAKTIAEDHGSDCGGKS